MPAVPPILPFGPFAASLMKACPGNGGRPARLLQSETLWFRLLLPGVLRTPVAAAFPASAALWKPVWILLFPIFAFIGGLYSSKKALSSGFFPFLKRRFFFREGGFLLFERTLPQRVRNERFCAPRLTHTRKYGIFSTAKRTSGCSAVGSAPALGAGCRGFKSLHSDQKSADA